MDYYDELRDLHDRRAHILGLINRANEALADIDEQIRLKGDNPEPDFSGAVERLRQKGILPKSSKK